MHHWHPPRWFDFWPVRVLLPPLVLLSCTAGGALVVRILEGLAILSLYGKVCRRPAFCWNLSIRSWQVVLFFHDFLGVLHSRVRFIVCVMYRAHPIHRASGIIALVCYLLPFNLFMHLMPHALPVKWTCRIIACRHTVFHMGAE